MEDTYGCNLINTKHDGRQVKEFVGKYHVHVLVRQGQMTFSDGKNSFTSRQGDLAIWQMSNTIQRVECSDDFEADVLLLSGEFLQQFNLEMVWASKGFVFIRINPTFHLDERNSCIVIVSDSSDKVHALPLFAFRIIGITIGVNLLQ